MWPAYRLTRVMSHHKNIRPEFARFCRFICTLISCVGTSRPIVVAGEIGSRLSSKEAANPVWLTHGLVMKLVDKLGNTVFNIAPCYVVGLVFVHIVCGAVSLLRRCQDFSVIIL